jgi:hypothetical protein
MSNIGGFMNTKTEMIHKNLGTITIGIAPNGQCVATLKEGVGAFATLTGASYTFPNEQEARTKIAEIFAESDRRKASVSAKT